MTSGRRSLKLFENFGGLVIGDGRLATFPGGQSMVKVPDKQLLFISQCSLIELKKKPTTQHIGLQHSIKL